MSNKHWHRYCFLAQVSLSDMSMCYGWSALPVSSGTVGRDMKGRQVTVSTVTPSVGIDSFWWVDWSSHSSPDWSPAISGTLRTLTTNWKKQRKHTSCLIAREPEHHKCVIIIITILSYTLMTVCVWTLSILSYTLMTVCVWTLSILSYTLMTVCVWTLSILSYTLMTVCVWTLSILSYTLMTVCVWTLSILSYTLMTVCDWTLSILSYTLMTACVWPLYVLD